MKIRNQIFALIGLTILWSCKNDDEASVEPQLFISAEFQNSSLKYEQTVFDGGVNGFINTFSKLDKTTNLQTFKNGTDNTDGFWTIRMVNIDIESLNLPYVLKSDEGTISWIDESAKGLQPPCSAPDVLCFYSGVGENEIEMTITEVQDGIITGEFEGRLFHHRFNPTYTKDLNDYVDISKGSFSIQYQSN